MAGTHANWISGKPSAEGLAREVISPVDGSAVGMVIEASRQEVERAVAAAASARQDCIDLPAHVRIAALSHVAAQLEARGPELAALITSESGKPSQWAQAEVHRAATTFRIAAEEARRWSGDVQRLDGVASGSGRFAITRRFPYGPVLAITPFNFPLNLVAHKVAPALAVGAPVVVKPAPKTPLSAIALGEILAECDLPAGAWSVIAVPDDRASGLVEDPRFPVVSFTGSGTVGWSIRDAVPRKHVLLELGGNATAIIATDWMDLAGAAQRIALFGNYQAGQSCISVQRVLVDRSRYEEAVTAIVRAVEALNTGDPRDEKTDVGPLIDVLAAQRVKQWIDEAVAAGGTVRTGGTLDGATLTPTVVTDVPDEVRLVHEEVFGPVLVVQPYDDLEQAFAKVNASQYGLQVGVFTHDVRLAFRAHRSLEVGGVIIGDVPSFRSEEMPYGGIKGSGLGREGVRSAMHDFTHDRAMVLSGVPL